jgi:hypothetical protein
VDWLLFQGSVLMLRSPPDFPALGESVSGFRAAIMPIRRTIIIILTGTTGGRTTTILNRIRIITRATDIPGITGVELTTATIAIIITTAIELTSLNAGNCSTCREGDPRSRTERFQID